MPTLQRVLNMSRGRRTITSVCAQLNPPSGHVFRVERVRGPVWYAKYRLPDGRQVQKKLGPAWGLGAPAPRLATSPNGWPTTGSGQHLSKHAAGPCRERSGPARHSRTPRPSSFDTASTIAPASRRRFVTTARTSTPTCSPPSAICRLKRSPRTRSISGDLRSSSSPLVRRTSSWSSCTA